MKAFNLKINVLFLLIKLMLINPACCNIEQLYSLNILLNALSDITDIETLNKPIFELKQMTPVTIKALDFKQEKYFTLNYRVEGFWESSFWNKQEGNEKFPAPKPHKNPWPGKKKFLKKLTAIEDLAKDTDDIRSLMVLNQPLARIIRYTSFCLPSPSRFEIGIYIGASEFEDTKEKIIWPSGYRPYYIDKFNVIPSEEFYNYVMNFSEK